MKPPSFPRAWPFCPGRPGRARREKGTAILVVFFTFFVFSCLGLSLVYLTRIFITISGHQKAFVLAGVAAENGVKRGYSGLLRNLEKRTSPLYLPEADVPNLKADAGSGGILTAERVLETVFPFQTREDWENLGWSSETRCEQRGYEDRDAYFLADFNIVVNGQGTVRGPGAVRRSSLVARLGVAAGRLPLAAFPFLLDKSLTPEQRTGFLNDHSISIAAGRNGPPAPASFGEGTLIPTDATGLLNLALKIKMFYPQKLSLPKLRAALGLPESNDPVPDAVYLIRDDLGLGGIYIQGDVEEMVTALDGDVQVILFKLEEGEWILRFSPSSFRTEFISPQGSEFFDLVPIGLVVVRGAVRSLGGGTIGGDGRPVLEKDREVPSLLAGVQLTIVSSGRVTIAADLIRQGLHWREGIPYLEDKDSQLVIFSTGKDFLDDGTTQGGIVIGGDSSRDIQVHGSLTAGGGGFRIEGGDRTVRLAGSLQTADFDTEGGKLILAPLAPGRRPSFPAWSPLTERPVLQALILRPETWVEQP